MTDGSSRRAAPATTLLSALSVPVAPVFGLLLGYRVIHPPRREQRKSPADLGLPSERIRVPMPGHRGFLDAWVCPGGNGQVVVIGHGVGLNKSASLKHAQFLHAAGYTVVLYDIRNHGESAQDRAVFGWSERYTGDAAAVIRYMKKIPEYRDAKYAMYGFSVSTFTALNIGTRDDCRVDAIICDSGPGLDYGSLFRNFLTAKGIPVPAVFSSGPARPVMENAFARLCSAAVRCPWPPPAERYADIPLLFLAGERDSIVPPAAVREIAERYPGAEFHEIPDGFHMRGIATAPEFYAKTVLDFLARAFES